MATSLTGKSPEDTGNTTHPDCPSAACPHDPTQQLAIFGAEYQPSSALTIRTLPQTVRQWHNGPSSDSPDLLKPLGTIFDIYEDDGHIIIPEPLRAKIRGWMNNDDVLTSSMNHQFVTSIYNKVIGEGTVFNYVRAKRPQPISVTSDESVVEKIAEESKQNCDLCNYKMYTAEDPLGRLESSHGYTVANAFKLDAWHSMAVFRTHHPIAWSQEELAGVFTLAMDWFRKVNETFPEYKYPTILWDCLPSAGASQMHPHIHMCLSKHNYYGRSRHWVEAAQSYNKRHSRNYFSDLLQMSRYLGLAVSYRNAHAMASLTPKYDHEVVMLADEPNPDLYLLIYKMIQGYFRVLHKFSFSMVMVLPLLDEKENASPFPIFTRLLPRGSLSNTKSEITSMELFSASNVNVDPFDTTRIIRESILEADTDRQF